MPCRTELDNHFPDYFNVTLAMRYGNPAIQDVMEEFRQQHCRYLLVASNVSRSIQQRRQHQSLMKSAEF